MTDDIESLFSYEGYDEVYKCKECSSDTWVIKTDGVVYCTACHDPYLIESFDKHLT